MKNRNIKWWEQWPKNILIFASVTTKSKVKIKNSFGKLKKYNKLASLKIYKNKKEEDKERITEMPRIYLLKGLFCWKNRPGRVITFYLKDDWGSYKGMLTKDFILIIIREIWLMN